MHFAEPRKPFSACSTNWECIWALGGMLTFKKNEAQPPGGRKDDSRRSHSDRNRRPVSCSNAISRKAERACSRAPYGGLSGGNTRHDKRRNCRSHNCECETALPVAQWELNDRGRLCSPCPSGGSR